jgi:predicted MFS family arabinose efflux permease
VHDFRFSQPNQVVAVCCYCALVVLAGLYVTIALAPAIATRFDVSETQATLSTSVFGLVYALSFPLVGWWSDRVGRRALIAVATALCGYAPTFPMFLCARAAAGAAAATYPSLAFAYLAERMPERIRVTVFGIVSFAFLVAAPVGQLAAIWLNGAIGLVGFWTVSGFLLAIGGVLFRLLPGDASATPHRLPARGDSRARVRDPRLLAAYLSAATLFFAFVVIFTALASKHSQLGSVAQRFRLLSTPVMLLTLVAGNFLKSTPAPRLLAFALAFAGVGCLSFAQSEYAPTLCGVVLVCAGVALGVPSLVTWISSIADDGRRGLALSLYSCCLFMGATAGAPFAALTARWFPLGPLIAAAALAISSTLCVCIAASSPPPIPIDGKRTS